MSLLSSLRALLARISPSREDLAARAEAEQARRHGTTPLNDLTPRKRARVSGVLEAVTYRPATEKPVLVARLYDGTGALDLVWLGRRRIAGITPGARLVAEGMVTAGRVRPVIYNPAYNLVGAGQ